MIIDIFNNFQTWLINNNILYPVDYLTELESINEMNNTLIMIQYLLWIIMIMIFINMIFNLVKVLVYAIKTAIF